MEAIRATTQAISLKHAVGSPDNLQAASTGQPFAGVLEKILSNSQFGSGFNSQLSSIQARVLSGVTFAPRDLLILQMQMGRFNMQVELVSKIAESATSSLRKIQNG